MKRFAFIVSLIISSTGYSQTQNILLAQVSGTDTLYYATLPAVTIQAKRSAASKRKHVRLIADIKRVYPYARLGAKILDSYRDSIASAESDREARVFYKRAEQELKSQYGREIKALNHRQGLLLIKLIDRETSHTAHQIISNSRSNLTAGLYQGIARIWGYDLKTRYDATKEYEIESALYDIYGAV